MYYANASFTGNQVSNFTGLDLVNAPLIEYDVNGDPVNPPVLVTNGSALAQQFSASKDYTSEFTNAAYFMTAITIMLLLLIMLLRKRIARAIQIFQEAR
jgi:hypothetical protein